MKRILWLLALVLVVGLATQGDSATKSSSGGVIKVKTLGMVLEIKGPDGRPIPIPANKDVPAPAGTYATCGITQYAKEGSTAVWSIASTGPYGDLKSITVSEGQPTTVEAGAPLAVKTSVVPGKDPKTGAPVVSVGLMILGKANEVYSAGTIMRGKVRNPQPPKLQILDESGKVLSQGNFEYG